MTTDNNDDNPSEKKEKRIFRIAVGSSNPCKVDAVRQALKRAIDISYSLDVDLEVEGFSVESGVPDQPFGDVSQWF
jgi:non-canonical (house-cleaning) NTP pyrophosphatase